MSGERAAELLRTEGPNALPAPRGRDLGKILLETGREPMFALLLGAAILYLAIGDVGEGLFLVTGALVAVGLVVAQEVRSERALAALRDLAQPHARVIRDGEPKRIPARELVPGDLMLVGEGERIGADALLVSADVLSVDESTLTGESAPIAKRCCLAGETFAPSTEPGAEESPFLFAGSLIVRGQGAARVARTGPRSALGRIGASLAEIKQEPTPLQKSAGRLVGLLGIVAIAFCVIVAGAYGVVRDDWVGGILAGITVAIALIPEEFPMVLAVFMALGAWRLATHRVLVRRSAVIETLGAASVLCVDKTGTLTENRMQVARLWLGGQAQDVGEGGASNSEVLKALRIARLASAAHPVDPMDRAIDTLVPLPLTARGPQKAWPMRSGRLAIVQMWVSQEGGVEVAAKGAPEAIFDLCRLPDEKVEALHAAITAFAEDGLRVLGIASADAPKQSVGEPEDLAFSFVGLIGFLDPLRANASAALKEAQRAGIKVVMITGDHPATAAAIARAAGIDTRAGVLTGSDIAQLPLPTLRERLREVRVFARIAPQQKLLLVEALRANGEVVAMTGDGVNDAPALEAAHVGIAMGRRGTDVAREAADLVLLDDSFASIVGGIRLGRRIFNNLRNALTYITAIHIPIAGLALAPILLGQPPLLFPMHVMVMELAIDPTCALVFEAERSEAKAMQRPPRRKDEALFGTTQITTALLQGGLLLLAVLALYTWALGAYPEAQARAGAFIALVVGNLTLALADAMASGGVLARRRGVYWAIVGGVVLILSLIFAVPAFAQAFAVALPDARLIALSVATPLLIGIGAALLRAWRDSIQVKEA
ncbi:MAG: cation-translocating P-type ATPase [Hyphomonadaceae bacterium]